MLIHPHVYMREEAMVEKSNLALSDGRFDYYTNEIPFDHQHAGSRVSPLYFIVGMFACNQWFSACLNIFFIYHLKNKFKILISLIVPLYFFDLFIVLFYSFLL